MFRFFLVCAVLLLVATGVEAGRYQRTKDRKIRVWNEHPEKWDEAIWTGERDQNGNATGPGVLSWYHINQMRQTGEILPNTRGQQLTLVRTFTGKMVEGRFEGLVTTTDDVGKEFHARYADGSRAGPWTAGPGAKESATSTERSPKTSVAASSSQEPPPPAESPDKIIRRSAVVEAPTQDSRTLEVFRPPSSLRASYAAADSGPPSRPDAATNSVSANEFEQQTESVLLRVRDATGDFREIERLSSVQPLPTAVSEKIHALANHGRELKSKTKENATVQNETATSDALLTMDEATRALASKDAAGADSKLAQFLQNHPSPPTETDQPLWRYLITAHSLCGRQQKQADGHLQKAQSLVAAGRTKDAIAEYEEANRLFPTPMISEKIRELRSESATNQP